MSIQNSPDSSGWMIALAKCWLFTECIVKNVRHLEDAIHKRIAGLSVTMKDEPFAP